MKTSILKMGIREKRKKLGLTIEDLAKKIGISRRYLSQIEIYGRLPSDKIFYKLKAALDLSVEHEKCYLNARHPQSTILSPVKSGHLSDSEIAYLRKKILALEGTPKEKAKLLMLIDAKKAA